MTAIVSSITPPAHRLSNGCATKRRPRTAELCLALCLALPPAAAAAQDVPPPPDPEPRAKRAALFLAGGALGLASHEGGHLVFDVAFDADPHLTSVDFHGIPFFAITPQAPLTRRRALMVSSAGFWVQHATSEWLLTTRPHIRRERAPVAKGVIAFNVLASTAYAGAAFARTGPLERDTRGLADAARMDERWVGALILAPAALDAIRYFNPDAKWATWTSRALKVLLVVLIVP